MTCILIKKVFQILPLTHHCCRNLMAVRIKTSSGRGPREIILGSAYLPYDDVELPPPGEFERLVMGCRAQGTHLIIGCDGNSHHTFWEVRISTTEESPCLITLWLMDWT
jgi:hypothetical protein